MKKIGRALLLPVILGLGLAACDTTKPIVLTGLLANHNPVVLEPLQAFPETIGPGDSAIVTCSATDADGDTLRYDWFSDCRLRMKGARGDDYLLNNTPEGRLVVYPGCVTGPIDTGWVSCWVRDTRGGGASFGRVPIIVQH